MIARMWRCTAAIENAPDYLAHFQHSVLPELQEIMGFEGAYVLQHALDDGLEITVITLWESMSAILSFAGERPENAVVEPAAQAVLRTFDSTVTHHNVLASPLCM